MKAFHGDPKIKEALLAQIRAHRAADQLIKGVYWENGKGCAIGCMIHSSDFSILEEKYGIPRQVGAIFDAMFEQLPNEAAMNWPERGITAIPVGVDLSLIFAKMVVWNLTRKFDGVIDWKTDKPVANVVKLFKRQIKRDEPTYDEWDRAASDASDAWDARAARAARAARDASDASDAWAARDASDAWINAVSEKLLELLRAAK